MAVVDPQYAPPLEALPRERARTREQTALLAVALPSAAAAVFYFVFIARTAVTIGGRTYFSLFDDAMISMRYGAEPRSRPRPGLQRRRAPSRGLHELPVDPVHGARPSAADLDAPRPRWLSSSRECVLLLACGLVVGCHRARLLVPGLPAGGRALGHRHALLLPAGLLDAPRNGGRPRDARDPAASSTRRCGFTMRFSLTRAPDDRSLGCGCRAGARRPRASGRVVIAYAMIWSPRGEPGCAPVVPLVGAARREQSAPTRHSVLPTTARHFRTLIT